MPGSKAAATSGGSTRSRRWSARLPPFADVVGHPRAKSLLAAAVAGRPSHAYLFVGPEASGKRTLAKTFAQALSCAGPPDDRPCGKCHSCRLIANDAHPDFRLIDKQGSGRIKSIPIEAVRALQHDASLSAHHGGYKVYVIDGAEALSLQAMDALLKTLEEPAERVVVILTCVDLGVLPQTVVSRCQVIRLGRVDAAEIAAALAARHAVEPEPAALLAHLSDGRPGRALALAADSAGLADRAAILDEIVALDRADRVERLKAAERMAQEWSKSQESLGRRLELLLLWWRDLMLVASGQEELVVNWDRLEMLKERAGRLDVAQARVALRAVELARLHLDENVQPRLALELMALTLPRIAA
jgi:DNA polymerase-3 subunit delta'